MSDHLLTIGFVLGVMVNVVKAGDLILRPHQQVRVQAFFEDLTLRVEAIRPIQWLDRLTNPRAHLILVLVGVSEFILVFAANVLLQVQTFGFVGSNAQVMQMAGFVFSIPALVLTVRLYGVPLVAWFLGERPVNGVLSRVLKITGLGFLVLLIYEVVLFGLVALIWGDEPFSAGESPFGQGGKGVLVVGAGVLLILPVFTWFWVITQVGALVLCAAFLVRICEILLRAVRAICWRIVEYNKGAWAALLLILTAVLGIAVLFTSGAG